MRVGISIFGGAGKNSVEALGTEGDDVFVVTRDGIFSAGRSTTMIDVQAVEIDGLFGNDQFDVISTASDVVTTLIGGGGSDTFNVGGDVATPVIARKVDGQTAFLNYGITSTDPAYSNLGVDGTRLTLAVPQSGPVQVTQPSGGVTVLKGATNGTDVATYSLRMTQPNIGVTAYVTIFAAMPPGSSVARGAKSVEVSTDGVHFGQSIVVAFDGFSAPGSDTAWDRVQTIYVRAPRDSLLDGDQSVLISHSIRTGNETVDARHIANVAVNVIDTRVPGVIVTVPDGGLRLAQNGVRSMVYDLALTRAPAAGETVRLKLNADPDLVSFSVVDHDQASRFKRNLNAITFDASNWNTPISVRVTAARDAPLPALTTLDIVQTLSSSRANGVYGNVSATTRVPVTIANSLTSGAGLLVLPKDPTAEVSVGTQTGYTVTLTKAPTAPVYVSLPTDGTTILTADPRGKQSNRFSLAPDGTAVVRFDSSNWNVPLSVNVAAKPGYVTSLPAPVQRVGTSPHSTALIQGQLIIEGLGLPNRDHALRQGVMLPTETDTRPAILDVAAFAATQTVTLNVFNDGSNKDDIGVLGLATATSGLAALYGQAMNTLDIATFGSITGLGMASGGIVYHNVQIVDVMLGTGDDTFTVNDTVAGSVTVVQGGGGSNRLIANGGGGADAPLVLFGGTSQDGSFYSSSPRQVDGHARTFTNPGDNIIDARNATKSVVMYGGVGRDTIYGGRGDDWIAGGSGANTLDGRGGNDIILGASGFNIDLSERLSRSAQMLKIANAGSQTDNRITGDKLSAGSNRISGGTGNNIVFGDYGVVVQEAGVQSIKTTTGVVLARTTRPSNGADNVIDVGDGNNVVFGALFDDVITAGNGRNILLGEFGTVHYVDGIVDLVTAIHAGSGGKNQITSGQGKNTVIGGAGADTIITGGGDNVVLADEGAVTYRGGVVVSVNATNPAFGGDDRITAGNGNNVVVGGNGMDKISAGNGDNVLFGDSGRVSYTKGVLTYAGTVGVGHGGNDAITMGNGSNIVVGGVGADSITGGDGKNKITGDDGSMGFVDGALAYVSTRNESNGGDDNITVGAGDNVGFGGMGSDTIQAGGGKNILFGDVGALQYRQSVLVSVESHYAGSDGDNQITVGNGKNVIVGGVRSDTIVAGDGGNVILGDHGEATYSAGVLTALKTQDPLSGGDDVIKSGSGVDVILGGAGSDLIDGGNGNNIVLGDHGMVRFDPSSKTASTIAGISLGLNGNNKITVGTGDSVIIGGTGTNAITGGDGHHIVFGAEGLVRFAAGKMTSAVSTTQFGGGDNVIKVGSGGSKVFGGAGNSAITAGDGENIIIGHNGEITTIGGQLRSVRTTYAQAGDMSGISIQAGDGDNLILGGSGGNTITVGDGNNRIAGANAEMLFANGKLKTFRSVDPNYQGSSHINAGGGSNTILGGGGADTIVAGDGKNIVIGDNGIVLSSASGSPTLIMSIDPSYAGDDQITVGSGDSVIMGGSGANTITVGDGDDLVFGGGGKVQYETGKLVDARTIDPSFAGNATITAGSGDSMIFGGSGFNKITTGAGNNKIIGANGLAQFADGKISTLRSLDPSQGASNKIETGNGANVIFGGRGYDSITAGDGRNIVIGDNGLVRFDASGGATEVRVLYAQIDGDDQISVGLGDNVLLGAGGTNTISAGNGHNIVFANDGLVEFASGKLVSATTIDPQVGTGTGGTITVGSGGSLVFGGAGDGAITAGDGDDIIIGHNGSVQYESGKLSLITTSSREIGSSVAIVAGGGDNLILGGSGANSIAVDGGDNIVMGHNGSIRFVDGKVAVVATRDPQYGGSASILTGDGRNIVLGGSGFNSITMGDGDNIILGANGQVLFVNGHVVSARSISPSYGGSVNIVTGAGADVIIGGGSSSTINAGSGTNVVIAHEGYVTFVDDVISRAQSNNQFFGSTAEIRAGDGNDVIIAGSGTTATYLGDGNHVVIMDNGYVRFNTSGVPTSAGTLYPGYAGIDSVITGNGNNVIFRGFAGDFVSTGTGNTIDLGQRAGFDLTKHGAFWQQAEQGAAAGGKSTKIPTTDELAVVVDQAKRIWRDALGATSDVLGALDHVHVEIGSLPTDKIGLNVGDLIVIDADAAGWGWFVDPTPADNEEFVADPRVGVFTASPGQPAAGHMDMLSTVLHELGNAMGFAEDTGRDVTGMSLKAGDRTIPVAEPRRRGDASPGVDNNGTAASRIDWAPREAAVGNGGSFSAPAWLSDFLLSGGEGATPRNPNAGIRVTMPIVTKPTE